ncbi:hypothetical protein SynM161_00879 [Synechococcus sp. M16.1]|nr:hypothetical protein SynM161_00879 [Synechococcus sp. M16.1]
MGSSRFKTVGSIMTTSDLAHCLEHIEPTQADFFQLLQGFSVP